MKKIFTVILCLFLMFVVSGCGSYEKAELSDFEYSILSPSKVLLNKYIGSKETLYVKGTIEGYNVRLGKECFKDNLTIQQIKIKNIYTIPAFAFENCDNLKNVKFKAITITIDSNKYAEIGNGALQVLKLKN